MIREFEFFHGSVFARIIHGSKTSVLIEPFENSSNALYVVNSTIGIYIKHSAQRLSPWRFTFTSAHLSDLLKMKRRFARLFVVLVCNSDGIVCIRYEELREVLGQHESNGWISASRRLRQMYSLKGSHGELEFKVGANEFPSKLFA